MSFTPSTPSGDEFVTIKEEKGDDSANFTIAMSRWSCTISYVASNTLSYGNKSGLI